MVQEKKLNKKQVDEVFLLFCAAIREFEKYGLASAHG